MYEPVLEVNEPMELDLIQSPNEQIPPNILDTLEHIHYTQLQPLYNRGSICTNGGSCITNSQTGTETLNNNRENINRRFGDTLRECNIKYLSGENAENPVAADGRVNHGTGTPCYYHAMINPQLRDNNNGDIYHVAIETNFPDRQTVYISKNIKVLHKLLNTAYGNTHIGYIHPQYRCANGQEELYNNDIVGPQSVEQLEEEFRLEQEIEIARTIEREQRRDIINRIQELGDTTFQAIQNQLTTI